MVVPSRKAPPVWLGRIRNFNVIHNLLALHPELAYWIIQWNGDDLTWLDLTPDSEEIKPYHFEIYYGKNTRRDAYYQRCFRRARKERGFIVAQFLDFHDLFYPLPADPDGRTFLYAGQFVTEPLDWEGITRRWRLLTGKNPASADPDFGRFVRMALKLPVLEPAALEGIESFVKLYAKFLTAEPQDENLHREIENLNHEVLSRQWPNNEWVDQATSTEKFRLTPWHHEGKLTKWMKEEMQIRRLPTTAMALMPFDSRQSRMDPLERRVRNHQIQNECIAFVQNLPETGANRLQDYGVTLVTSTSHNKNRGKSRIELRERAEKLRAVLKERLGIRCVVGIGRSLTPGAPLHESHREAVLALHLCVQLEEGVLFYDDHYQEDTGLTYAQLHRAGQTLIDTFSRVSGEELRLATDQYVRLVLIYADERVEVARSLLLAMLYQLIAGVQRAQPVREDVVEEFATEMSATLEDARSVSDVIESFKEAAQRLSVVASKGAEGAKAIRLEATLQYLKENFSESLRLPEVARKAGFSVPSFSRAFKQETGTSFLAYLRTLRIEQAKLLLRTTSLPLAQVAQSCGFQSEHRLIRSFKKETSLTPGGYRKEFAAAEE